MKAFQSFILRAAIGLIFLLVNIVSIYLFLRGHNAPGGGFIGGLSTGMSFILLGLALGWRELEQALPLKPLSMATIGLSIAVASSILPMLAGLPFLTQLHSYITVPMVGKLHVGTALLFDLGVFLLVTGITLKLVIVTARSTAGLAPFKSKEQRLYASPLERPIEELNAAAEAEQDREEETHAA